MERTPNSTVGIFIPPYPPRQSETQHTQSGARRAAASLATPPKTRFHDSDVRRFQSQYHDKPNPGDSPRSPRSQRSAQSKNAYYPTPPQNKPLEAYPHKIPRGYRIKLGKDGKPIYSEPTSGVDRLTNKVLIERIETEGAMRSSDSTPTSRGRRRSNAHDPNKTFDTFQGKTLPEGLRVKFKNAYDATLQTDPVFVVIPGYQLISKGSPPDDPSNFVIKSDLPPNYSTKFKGKDLQPGLVVWYKGINANTSATAMLLEHNPHFEAAPGYKIVKLNGDPHNMDHVQDPTRYVVRPQTETEQFVSFISKFGLTFLKGASSLMPRIAFGAYDQFLGIFRT